MKFDLKSIIRFAVSNYTNCKAEGQGVTCKLSLGSINHWYMDIGFFTRTRLFLVLMFISVWFWSTPLLAEKTVKILIILNANDDPYREAVAGFKAQIATFVKPIITEQSLAQMQSSGAAEIERLKPDIIFTLGNESLKWVNQHTSRIPIVATMVLREESFKQASNITGVSLSHPLSTQFQWLRKFFPQQTSVAILFNPAENAGTVKLAKDISLREGLKLVAIPVETPKELPYALEQLASNVELLLAIPDETVMSLNTAKEVLLASFINKVPLIGLSDNWVKSGAFYALSWDYADLGKQNALLAQKILNGTPVSAVTPEHPRKVAYTVNAKIAEHMNMDIPDEILKNAKKVFH